MKELLLIGAGILIGGLAVAAWFVIDLIKNWPRN